MGFWQRFLRTMKYSANRYISDKLGQRAVVLTYYTLFSVVPLAALFFGIAKGFSLEEQLQVAIYSRFPKQQHEVLGKIYSVVDNTLQQASGGVVAGVGVIALLWTVVWLIANIEAAFNAVWCLPPRRNIWRKCSDYISLLLLTPLVMVTMSALGMIIKTRLIAAGLSGVSGGDALVEFIATAAGCVVNCVLFSAVYMFVPNTKVRILNVLWAGVFAGIGFQVLQDGFLFLQKWVFAYNRIYGSFAALPLFLIWVNWSWQLILFGAEISFVRQHLDSGVFDDGRVQQMSRKLRCEHQLAIVHHVFSEFQQGKGIAAEQTLANALKLPDYILRDEIDELLEHGLLCRGTTAEGRAGLLPAVPPENFTVLEFLQKMNGCGDGETPEFARFDKLFNKIENQVISSDCNKNIYQI